MVERLARDRERLDRIFDAIEESIAAASDEEILEDLKDLGEGFTSRTRDIFARELTNARKRRLTAAKAAYGQEIQRLTSGLSKIQLPAESIAQRALLHRTLKQHPELTAQFRDFERLEDTDVTSCLQQLGELGLLDDESETQER